MKTVIFGSRWLNLSDFEEAMKNLDAYHKKYPITEVVSGKCPNGGDLWGELWAEDNKIPIIPFPANWKKFKRSAGPIRNAEMVRYAERGIAFWDSKSPGTKNMIDNLEKLNKHVTIWRFAEKTGVM